MFPLPPALVMPAGEEEKEEEQEEEAERKISFQHTRKRC